MVQLWWLIPSQGSVRSKLFRHPLVRKPRKIAAFWVLRNSLVSFDSFYWFIVVNFDTEVVAIFLDFIRSQNVITKFFIVYLFIEQIRDAHLFIIDKFLLPCPHHFVVDMICECQFKTKYPNTIRRCSGIFSNFNIMVLARCLNLIDMITSQFHYQWVY